MPPILPSPVANPIFGLYRFRGLDGTLPSASQVISIVRVYGDESALVVECLPFAQASEVEPAIVHPLELALGVARPDNLRQTVGQRPVRRVVALVLSSVARVAVYILG